MATKATVEAGEAATEKMRKALLVVVQALETKSKDRAALIEIWKEIDKNQPAERSVEALVEALVALVETGKEEEAVAVAVDRNQTERCSPGVQKIFDEWQWVDDELFDEDDVDEEDLKHFTELQEECNRVWLDCVDRALKAGLKFSDPSRPNCIVACPNPWEK